MRQVKAVSFSHNVFRLEELKNTIIKMGGAANKHQLIEAGFNPKLLGFDEMRVTSSEVQQVIDSLPKITFMVTFHKGEKDSVIFKLTPFRHSALEKEPALKRAFELIQEQRIYDDMPETHETKMVGWANYIDNNGKISLLGVGTNFDKSIYEKLSSKYNISMSVFEQLNELMFGYSKPTELLTDAFLQLEKDLSTKSDRQIKQEKISKSISFNVMVDELEKSLKISPIKWRPLTDDEMEDEIKNESDLQEHLGIKVYPVAGEYKKALGQLKQHSSVEEIDPNQLSDKNNWRFNFDNYKQMKNQVTSYGGPKDPDSLVRAIQSGNELPMPVVVRRHDGSLLLGGGATRTSIAKLAGQKIKALVFDQKSSDVFNHQKAKNQLREDAEKLGINEDGMEALRIALHSNNNEKNNDILKEIYPHINYIPNSRDYNRVIHDLAKIEKHDYPDLDTVKSVLNVTLGLRDTHKEIGNG